MFCGSECLSIGPPPDWILHIPPPPLPEFFFESGNLTPTSCLNFKCPSIQNVMDNNIIPVGVEYHELPRHEPATGDDTWFLVLVSGCTAIFCIAALLALFLLRCRQVQGGCKSGTGKSSGSNALYAGGIDSRVLWAALTPRGTRHFVGDNFPHDDEDHYECIDPPLYKLAPPADIITRHYESEYECPAPLIEAYAHDGYFKTGIDSMSARPFVSSPTRIDRPNLPPLNLQPRTLRKSTHSRRVSDAAAPEKGM